MSKIEILKDYRNNAELRYSFNELAKKTFGLNFEDWYQNGYWTKKYNPHSIFLDGRIVANVSVNRTDFVWNGKVKHLIQLGTVMTDEAYRNRGLIRLIMEDIEKEYADKADGMYLFASDSVLSFYPKFGFVAAGQKEYVKEITGGRELFKKVPMKEKKDLDLLQKAIEESVPQGPFEMVGNSELNMFYVSKFMKNCVYYEEATDTYVIAEIDDGELLIDMVVSKQPQDMNRIAEGFGNGIKRVRLGFTPEKADGFTVREWHEDDCTLHLKGKGTEPFREEALMFPILAHA